MVLLFCKNTLEDIDNELKASVKANPNKIGVSPNTPPRSKRMMLFSKSYTYLNKASMTVEAALAVPIFLFFIINLLSLIIMYEKYSYNLATLHQKAKLLSVTGNLMPGSGDELISLTFPQAILPFVNEIGFKGSIITVTAKCRKWTGYTIMNTEWAGEEDEYVYMTENGSVYHRSRECSHLKIGIQTISPGQLTFSRNENGERYKKCEKCGNGVSTGMFFITKQGNKYHNSVNCSGLKRQIRTVRLSDIPGVPGCGVCT